MNNFELDRRAKDLAAGNSGYNLARRLLMLEQELSETRREAKQSQQAQGQAETAWRFCKGSGYHYGLVCACVDGGFGVEKSAAPAAVPEGWKLVPIEPTVSMLKAASQEENECAVHNYGGHPESSDYWYVMLSAAPDPAGAK